MDWKPVPISSAEYPKAIIRRMAGHAPTVLHVAGSASHLSCVQMAVLCSVRCPGSVIIKALDATREIKHAGIIVAGGFHSPMESDCLQFLLRGSQSVVWCPAQRLGMLRLEDKELEGLRTGRLSIASIFTDDVEVMSPESATQRNRFVGSLADTVFVPFAAAGGKVEQEVLRAIVRGQTVLTIDDETNADLIGKGARPVLAANLLTTMSAGAQTRGRL